MTSFLWILVAILFYFAQFIYIHITLLITASSEWFKVIWIALHFSRQKYLVLGHNMHEEIEQC